MIYISIEAVESAVQTHIKEIEDMGCSRSPNIKIKLSGKVFHFQLYPYYWGLYKKGDLSFIDLIKEVSFYDTKNSEDPNQWELTPIGFIAD